MQPFSLLHVSSPVLHAYGEKTARKQSQKSTTGLMNYTALCLPYAPFGQIGILLFNEACTFSHLVSI